MSSGGGVMSPPPLCLNGPGTPMSISPASRSAKRSPSIITDPRAMRAALLTSRPTNSSGNNSPTGTGCSPVAARTPLADNDCGSRHSGTTHGRDTSVSEPDAPTSVEAALRTASRLGTPEMQLVLQRYFSNDPKAMALYLSAAIGEPGIIENHQDAYRNEFVSFIKECRWKCSWASRWELATTLYRESAFGTTTTNQESLLTAPTVQTHCVWFSRDREKAHPVNGVAMPPAAPTVPDTQYSYGLYRYEHIIQWLLHFLSRPRGSTNRYRTILEIPKAYILPFFDASLRKHMPNFPRAFADTVLTQDSPERRSWWTGLRPTLMLRRALYPYQYVESVAEDIDCLTSCASGLLTGSNTFEVKTRSSAALAAAHAEFQSNDRMAERVSILTRTGITAYLYLLYGFVQVDIGENNFEETDLVDQLLPILWAMIVGDETALDPIRNPLLCRLHERRELSGPNDNSVIQTMARMADEIRFVALENHSEDDRILRPADKLRRETLVSALFRRTHSLYGSTGPLRELCKITLADESRMSLRRQIQVAVHRVGFSRFVHQLEDQLCLVRERINFREWLTKNLPWIRYDDILWARSITADMPNINDPAAHRLEQQRRALSLLRHIDDCDRRMVVQRISNSVTLDEVQLSLAYYRAVFPACVRNLNQMFYVGVDKHGIYLVAERSNHAMLTQTMLLAACVSPGFRHNMPLFPALARMYYTTFDVNNQEGAEDARAAELPVLHPDHHARHCVVTIVGHWLGLPTNSPNDRLVPIDNKTRVVTRSGGSTGGNKQRSAVSLEDQKYLLSVSEHDRSVTVTECFIPDPVDSLLGTDSALSNLHKFVAHMEEALGLPFDRLDTLTDQLAEALAGALELKRSRQVDADLFEEICTAVPALATRISTLTSESGTSQEKPTIILPEKGKKRKVTFVDTIDKQPQHLEGGEAIAELYSVAAEGRLGKDLFRRVFLEGGLVPVGRPVVTCATLRRSAPIPDESNAEKQYTRTVTGGYTKMFAVACSTSLRGLKHSIQRNKEPIEPLGHLLRLLEAKVAPTTLAEALGDQDRKDGLGNAAAPKHVPYSAIHALHPESPGLMDNVTSRSLAKRFDFAGFLGARETIDNGAYTCRVNPHEITADLTLEQVLKLRAARARVPPLDLNGAIPQSSATTFTPVQFWPSSEGATPSTDGKAPSTYVVYLENLFTVVTFPGGTYAHHLKEFGMSDRVIATEAYNVNPTDVPHWRPMMSSRFNASITPEMLFRTPRTTTVNESNNETEDDLEESADKVRHRVTWTGGTDQVSMHDSEQLWLAMRAERNALLHVINTSRRLAEAVPGGTLPADASSASDRLLVKIRQLMLHSQELRTTYPLPPNFGSVFHPCIFPFRFADRAAMATYIGDVLRSRLPGETEAKHAERLWAEIPDRSSYLLANICKLYEACDSNFGEANTSPSIRDAYNLQVDVSQASEAFSNTYMAIAEEAIRRGLLHRAVKMKSGGEEEGDTDMSEASEYFE